MRAGLAAQLRAWRWIALWLLATVAVASQVPPRVALGSAHDRLPAPRAWASSAGLALEASDQGITVRAVDRVPQHASQRVSVPAAATFVAVEACFGAALERGSAAVMLASVSEGQLDFNRAYILDTLDGVPPGECVRDAFPRRAGDGDAVLQLQVLTAGAGMQLTRLATRAEAENPAWRQLRGLMLCAGLVLVVLRFRSFSRQRPTPVAALGLLTVAAILFGCCISVDLKADSYALLTGGRQAPAPADMAALLATRFPIGGFAIFTGLHALLFAVASIALGLVDRRAWIDLLLLAVVTEALQVFVPGRGPGLGDVLVDWSGVCSGMLAVVALRRIERVRLFLQEQGVDEDIARF